MCDGEEFSAQFESWLSFSAAANIVNRNRGFAGMPSGAGVYCLRVREAPTLDLEGIEHEYRNSSIFLALKRLDGGSETLLRDAGLGAGWGWDYSGFASGRASRVRQIRLDPAGRLSCPIVYFGKSNSLRRRMRELVTMGHTVNHALWALMVSGWRFDLGWKGHGRETEEEERLKDIYRGSHGQRLAPLMYR